MTSARNTSQALEARKRTFVGFSKVEFRLHSEIGGKLDAIYIPTNHKRSIPDSRYYSGLFEHTDKLFVVSTDNEKAAGNSSNALMNVGEHPQFDEHAWLDRIQSLASGRNPSVQNGADYNLPSKRNFAIQHARTYGYQTIMLLDDDIFLSNSTIRAARRAAQNWQMVGFYVLDYPDISCLDILRSKVLNTKVEVSPAGNCLILNLENVRGFFPYCYNEDWLFMYGANHGLEACVAGEAIQLPHSSWTDPSRLSFEQFGDIIASGMLDNQKKSRHPLSGDLAFWVKIRDYHCASIEKLLCATNDPVLSTALTVAQKAASHIEPIKLVNFIANYKAEIGDGYERK